ncbi:MAG: SlyX family protein [Pseudomonadota bacterium]
MSDEQAKKIENLEMQVAHQQVEIDDLRETVDRHWRELEDVKIAIKLFADRLGEVERGHSDTPVTKPPHY